MAVSNGNPANQQLVLDANYIQSTAMPNNGTTVNTNAIDLLNPQGTSQTSLLVDNLGTNPPFPATRYVIVQILTGASACSANSKNVNVTLQQANAYAANGLVNTGNFANIPVFATPLLRVTDASGNTPAGTVNVMLPPNVSRYIRAQAIGEANGGTPSTDSNVTLQLLF